MWSYASILCCSVYRPLLPRSRCHGGRQSFRRLRFRLTVSSLYEERHRLRRRRSSCLRRQMTVWLRVWMIQTLPCGASRFRGHNTLLLCLHVLSAGPSGASDWVGFQDLYDTARGIIDLCECPIRKTIPLCRLFHWRDPEGPRGTTPVLRVTYNYTKCGDLWCTGGNPAYGLLPLPIQSRVVAGCRESLRLQFRRAVHIRTRSTVPEELVYLGVIVQFSFFLSLTNSTVTCMI